jgi:uncharacterized membrane protein
MPASAQRINQYDVLKLVALLAMTIDHVGAYLLPDMLELRVIGRVAAPIFCFLIGFNGSYRFRSELLIAAVAMSVADTLLDGSLVPLNILWLVLLIRVALQWLDAHPTQPLNEITLLVASVVVALPSNAVVEWGSATIAWALWGRAVRQQAGRKATAYGMLGLLLMILLSWAQFPFTPAQTAAMIVLLFGVYLALQKISLKEYKVQSRVLRAFSRHALSYYIAHKTVLMVIARFWAH